MNKRKMNITGRKSQHINICTHAKYYSIESAGENVFSGLRFLHNPLPELALEDIDTRVNFLGHTLRMPLFISCMTGGAGEGYEVNRHLARAGQLCGIPVGMGSVRVLFSHPELFFHFHIKPLAPDVPVLANIGIVQLQDMEHYKIIELVKRLEAQALVIHLNPGQELFQPDGDSNFRNLKDALARFRKQAPFPCMVKETGFGIPPSVVRFLEEIGIDYIDVAGSGGTNWVAVESYSLASGDFEAAREFDVWGYPTAYLLELLKGSSRIIASGGLRTGMDLAKCIALGAVLGGMALPFIRAAVAGGTEEIVRLISQVEKSLKVAMLLTGSRDLAALQSAPLWRNPVYLAGLRSLEESLAKQL